VIFGSCARAIGGTKNSSGNTSHARVNVLAVLLPKRDNNHSNTDVTGNGTGTFPRSTASSEPRPQEAVRAAYRIPRVVGRAGSFVHGHLRIGPQRTRHIHLAVRYVLRQNLRGSDAFLAPAPDHRHFVELISAGASAAVDDPVPEPTSSIRCLFPANRRSSRIGALLV
jgi:hypothetical protein